MEGEVILVAVDARKEITDYALEWAVRNVIKSPTDFLILLALLPSCPPRPPPASGSNPNYQSPVYQFLSGLLKKKDTGQDEQSSSDKSGSLCGDDDAPNRINMVCGQMMQRQLSLHHVDQVQAEVKVVADAQRGSVAMVAGEVGATWVILDRRLKKEAESCLSQLHCNVILIDHAIPNILRSTNYPKPMIRNGNLPTASDMLGLLPKSHNPNSKNNLDITQTSLVLNSPYLDDAENSLSLSSIDRDPFKKAIPTTKFKPANTALLLNPRLPDHETEAEASSSSIPFHRKSQTSSKASRFEMESPPESSATPVDKKSGSYNNLLKTRSDVYRSNSVKSTDSSWSSSSRSLDLSKSSQKLKSPNQSCKSSKRTESNESIGYEADVTAALPPTIDRASSVRRAISLSIKQPPMPPPLCSICKHNAPIFGRAPQKFSYKEMERATNGFSSDNFLAEGGYGPVYRGVLADGLVVAVKKHKTLSAQGASEFCAEVEVLSCAQHRNLVMLMGYCVETEWLLVYEFACNGSLDKHLYGTEENVVMAWQNRVKVAVGAARGLRYLHEDCRVGCIVHRDFRPTNILLTHDFEPMVGDFGLARWQVDGQSAEETRVVGAFGYLAPEYTQSGLITEKADVYAFGVVLLELLTGIKATEFSRKVGRRQHSQEQGGSSLERKMLNDLIDPRLKNNYVEKEAECMFRTAVSCISPLPERRPRISKVLKILEGDLPSFAASHTKQSLEGYTRDGPRYPMPDSSCLDGYNRGGTPYPMLDYGRLDGYTGDGQRYQMVDSSRLDGYNIGGPGYHIPGNSRVDGYIIDGLRYQMLDNRRLDYYYPRDGPPQYQMLDDNPLHLMQSNHHMNLSQTTQCADRINDWKSRFSHTPPFDRYNLENGSWDLNRTQMTVNQEYEEYLQGSLSKFVRKLPVN